MESTQFERSLRAFQHKHRSGHSASHSSMATAFKSITRKRSSSAAARRSSSPPTGRRPCLTIAVSASSSASLHASREQTQRGGFAITR